MVLGEKQLETKALNVNYKAIIFPSCKHPDSCIHVQHCLHTRACRDMSQVVRMSGWRRLGPLPRMHEWKSTETIVLSSDTAAIFRAWRGEGFENVAQSVYRDTVEGRQKSDYQLGGETMVIFLLKVLRICIISLRQ